MYNTTRGDQVNEEFWDDLYRVDAAEAWLNGGYDEQGNSVPCDSCGEEMKFDEEMRNWVCTGCGRMMSRAHWFNYIGATPPGGRCLVSCGENYPMCKRWCTVYEIPLDDPMM